MKTALYRHFDASDRLLYVGVSLHPIHRLASHTDSAWVSEIARVAINYFPDKAAAMAAEREAISTEKPLHNVSRNSVSSKYRSPTSVMLSVRLPEALFNAINMAALEDDLSRTDAVVCLLEAALIAREET